MYKRQTRCLAQIAQENKTKRPIACAAIANDFYVDDLMTGSDNPHILSNMKSDVTELLSQYGFTLHKWFSNDQTIITSQAHSFHDFSKNQTVRTLGIQWNMDEDSFLYSVQRHVNAEVVNKRGVLSVIAGIYDPLGLIGPVTFWCKHFMQRLWLTGTSWDEPLSDSLSNQWLELYSQLVSDTYFKISHRVATYSSMIPTGGQVYTCLIYTSRCV